LVDGIFTRLSRESASSRNPKKATYLISQNIVEIRDQFHQHFTRAIFVHRSQKRKKTDSLTVFFALMGSASVKAACKMLVKSMIQTTTATTTKMAIMLL